MNYKIHFETLGCRLNQDESEGASRAFSLNEFICESEGVTSKTQPDSNVILCVINTCTVTGKAEQKARRIIRLCLEKYPDSVVLVTGCYAENSPEEIKSINSERICVLPGTKKYLLQKISVEIKKLFENQDNFSGLLPLCEKIISNDSQNNFTLIKSISKLQDKTSVPNAFTLFTPVFQKHSRASLKIQDGCNNCCAFCKIHFARGKSVSMPVAEAVKRARLLEESGAEEIVLTGVNLSQYSASYFLEDEKSADKIQSEEKHDFAFLLNELLQNTEKVNYRISSFYPQSITVQLCKVLENPRVVPFFHLSIQSGSDEILRKMNRPYGMNVVLDAVKLLRKTKDNPFISCDIIAGFPGETEDDFNLTEKMCSECNFAWIHAFPFSPRPGTSAAVMKPMIPERIKDERVLWLTEKAVEGKINYIHYWMNKPLYAVVENPRAERMELKKSAAGESENNSAADKNSSEKKYMLHCVTDNFIHVEFQSDKLIASGSRILVKINEVLKESIIAGKETEAAGQIVLQ